MRSIVARFSRFSPIVQNILTGIFCTIVIFLFLASMVGCQGRVTFEANGYYPDSNGDKHVGDPRKPMFEGSGYSEDDGQTNPSSDYSKYFDGRKAD